MNIPEGKLGTAKNVRDSSKNPGEQDDKKSSPLETSDLITSNDNLNAYRESGRDNDTEKGKERKKKTWKHGKLYIWNLNQMMTWKNNQRMLMM